jgi:hypothetical protein
MVRWAPQAIEFEPQMSADERGWSACSAFGLALAHSGFNHDLRSSAARFLLFLVSVVGDD